MDDAKGDEGRGRRLAGADGVLCPELVRTVRFGGRADHLAKGGNKNRIKRRGLRSAAVDFVQGIAEGQASGGL